MKFTARPLVFALLLVSLFLAAPDARAQDNLRGEPPDWVILQSLPTDADFDPATLAGGIDYLLVDRQTNIPAQQSYAHFAFRVTNSDGVQNMSDISVSFDPSYQTLQFHLVRLHRDGRIIDNLSDHEIQIFQRESGMERNLYDGSETAVINQKNVHIGDIIEYAYTLTGFNPIHEGNYFSQQYFQYGLAIGRFYIRLIDDPDRPLHFHYLNDAPEVTLTPKGSGIEYTWDVSDTPAYLYEDYAPPWFDPYPNVWISSFDTWSQVVDWALPHYEVDASDVAALGALENDIAPAKDLEERILQTIRFVQDEIRYLGMEQGLGAYRPNQPLGVYERRFGDCKDKSLLLSTLLRDLGVEADPVLVNTMMKDHLDADAPTPIAFDHCIVRFRYEGKDRFVDPTWSNQGGDLKHMSDPPYGVGLVLADGVRDLAKLPAPAIRKVDITYKFTIEEVGGPALLDVRTVYAGSEADRHRDQMLNYSTDEISRDNLDYYSQSYPGISMVQPTRYQDQGRDGDNILIVEESYRIEDFWESTTADSLDFYAELTPLEISEVTDVPSSADRAAPYYLGQPLDMTLKMEIEMPEDWPVETARVEIKGDAFAYNSELKSKGNLVQASYRYQRLKESIPAGETSRFFADHDRIREDLLFFLSYDPGLESYQFSGLASALMLAALLLGLFLARRVHFGFDPAVGDNQWAPLPLGGWLILLIPGLLARIGYLLFDLVSVFLNHNTWLVVLREDGFSSFSMLGTMLTVELLGNTLFLVFTALLFWQLVKKRSSFPRLMVIYLVSFTVFILLDSLGVRFLINDPSFQTDSGEDLEMLILNIIGVVLWSPYLLKARRPRHTFVNRLTGIDSVEVVATEVPEVLEIPETPNPETPAPTTLPDPRGIRIVRWPVSLVLTAILQFLGSLGLIISVFVNWEAHHPGTKNTAETAGFYLGTIMGITVPLLLPLIGGWSIVARRRWSRIYNAVLLFFASLVMTIAGIVLYRQSTDPDPISTLLGALLLAVPLLFLAVILLVSRAARTFPAEYMAYRSSVPRVSPLDDGLPEDIHGPQDICRHQVLGLFRKLVEEFPECTMSILDQDSETPLALTIMEQPGIPRRIILDLQKKNVLNLTIGPVWLTWSPCDRPVVREEFYNTVSGLLAGRYRLVEYRRDNDLVLARIQRLQGEKWVRVHQWSRDRWTSKRGLKEEVVFFGNK